MWLAAATGRSSGCGQARPGTTAGSIRPGDAPLWVSACPVAQYRLGTSCNGRRNWVTWRRSSSSRWSVSRPRATCSCATKRAPCPGRSCGESCAEHREPQKETPAFAAAHWGERGRLLPGGGTSWVVPAVTGRGPWTGGGSSGGGYAARRSPSSRQNPLLLPGHFRAQHPQRDLCPNRRRSLCVSAGPLARSAGLSRGLSEWIRRRVRRPGPGHAGRAWRVSG
jgi:hypothetical protein